MDWQLNAELRQHALDCGLNMTNADAVHINDARGFTLAHDICDPEYQDRLLFAGTTLTQRAVDWLKSFGVDYVTVRV